MSGLVFLQKFFKGFMYAFQGICTGFSERNMRVHGIAFVVVVGLGLWLRISLTEWIVVLMLSGMVMAAELVNTAVEELGNCLRDECHLPYKSTGRARDLAAGAVLVLAVVSAVVGIIIFLPKLLVKFF